MRVGCVLLSRQAGRKLKVATGGVGFAQAPQHQDSVAPGVASTSIGDSIAVFRNLLGRFPGHTCVRHFSATGKGRHLASSPAAATASLGRKQRWQRAHRAPSTIALYVL